MAKPRPPYEDGRFSPATQGYTGEAMKLEFFWYEISPFVYTVSGGFLLGKADALLPVLSSVLLLTAGGTILFLRRRQALRTREEALALRTAVVDARARARAGLPDSTGSHNLNGRRG